MQKIPQARVDIKRRLVCVWSRELECFEVSEITVKGKVSKMFTPKVSFEKDFHAAMRLLEIPYSGFKTVPGGNHLKPWHDTWNGWKEAIWAKANPITKTKKSKK